MVENPVIQKRKKKLATSGMHQKIAQHHSLWNNIFQSSKGKIEFSIWKAIEEAKEQLATLENELKGKKFFSGDEIGLVDNA